MWRRATTSRTVAATALATVLLGVAVLGIVAAGQSHSDDTTTGTVPVGVVGTVTERQSMCQRGMPLSGEPVDRLVFIAQPGKDRATIEVTIRPTGGGSELARRRVTFVTDVSGHRTVDLPRIDRDGSVDVCFRGVGRRGAAVFGEGPAAGGVAGNSTTELYVGGKPAKGDMVLYFERPEPATTVALLPLAFERAARWRPGFVGAWTYWTLLALGLIGAPVALARAVIAAVDEDDEPAAGA